jgi:hypothetical protein
MPVHSSRSATVPVIRPWGIGFGDRRAAADVDADPRVERLPVLSRPGHIALDRGDRVAVLEAGADRGDEVGKAGLTGEIGHRVEHPAGQTAALELWSDLHGQHREHVGTTPCPASLEGSASIAHCEKRTVAPSSLRSMSPLVVQLTVDDSLMR